MQIIILKKKGKYEDDNRRDDQRIKIVWKR